MAGIGLGAVPKQRRGIEARDRLYAAAIAEFSVHGAGAARVEDVVAAAGTGWGTFFRYFPRKEDVLLEGAVRHLREYVLPGYEAGLAARRPVREVASGFFAGLTTPRLEPRLHAEMLAETINHPARFAAMLGGGEQPVAMLLATLMESGQQRGEVRSEVSSLVCATVLAGGVVFSTAPVLRAVAAGQLPGTAIATAAAQAFDLAWRGVASAPID